MKVLIGPNPYGLEQVIPELGSKHPELELLHCGRHQDLKEAICDAEVYLGWLGRRTFLAARSLEWIQSPSSGVDKYLAVPEIRESGVILTSAAGTHGGALADHAFAVILALSRGIRGSVLQQQAHRWSMSEIRPTLRELAGSTLGAIGFGSVGKEVAKRARGFDMRILAVDLLPGDRPDYVERLAGADGLERLLAESDFVVVTVPYTPATRGMIDAGRLDLMKPSAVLVGISRGGVVDEAALADRLRQGKLAGAALDVFEEEPLPEESPLWDVPNLLITPHVAGGTQFETERILALFTENLERFLAGRLPLRNQVDKARGF